MPDLVLLTTSHFCLEKSGLSISGSLNEDNKDAQLEIYPKYFPGWALNLRPCCVYPLGIGFVARWLWSELVKAKTLQDIPWASNVSLIGDDDDDDDDDEYDFTCSSES